MLTHQWAFSNMSCWKSRLAEQLPQKASPLRMVKGDAFLGSADHCFRLPLCQKQLVANPNYLADDDERRISNLHR
jgi:hypothetical protein